MTNLRCPKILFGLTGGIASGKSTVAKRFRERGIPVIDADLVAREALAVEPVIFEVVKNFGVGVLGPDKKIDRAALADIVFSDTERLTLLEDILDPFITSGVMVQASNFQRDGHEVVGVEAALLIEKEWTLKPLIVVAATEALQVQRGMARDNSNEFKIRARMSRQLPTEEKVARADIVIVNDGDLETLHRMVDEVVGRIILQARA